MNSSLLVAQIYNKLIAGQIDYVYQFKKELNEYILELLDKDKLI